MKLADQGQFTVDASLEQLLPLITDPAFMARALPDVKAVTVDGPDRASVKMAVGVSHVRGVLPARFRLERPEAHRLVVRADAQGMGSRVDLMLDFRLSEQDHGVLVDWASSAEVNGLLASVGAGLLRPLTRQKFDAVVQSVRAALAAATA